MNRPLFLSILAIVVVVASTCAKLHRDACAVDEQGRSRGGDNSADVHVAASASNTVAIVAPVPAVTPEAEQPKMAFVIRGAPSTATLLPAPDADMFVLRNGVEVLRIKGGGRKPCVRGCVAIGAEETERRRQRDRDRYGDDLNFDAEAIEALMLTCIKACERAGATSVVWPGGAP